VADQHDKKGRSRRARRREQAKAEAAARPAKPGEPEPALDEAEGETEQDEAEQQGDAEAPTKQRLRPAGDVPRTRAKKQRRRARGRQDDESEQLERIRDRNRQVREQAAAARQSRKRDRSAAVAQGLDTGELVDDALARSTHVAFQWLRRHFNIVQWVAVVAVAVGIGWQIYSWRAARTAEKEADKLMAAVAAENGQVGPAPAEQAPSEQERPRFANDDARLAAAAEAYVEAADGPKGAATTILGSLGLAGVLFDQGRFDEALSTYQTVKDSELAKHDPDVKGRSLEGMGLCLEAKKDVEGALRVFRELENTETPGFVSLAQYHQARLLHASGKQKEALELIKRVREKLSKDRSADEPPGYLEVAARELQHTIDPASAAAVSSLGPQDLAALREQMRALQELVAREKPDLSREQLEELMKDPAKVQKLLESLGRLPASLASAATPATPAPSSSR
jgi:tetratricopeptide (TPR) repeat protein